MVHSILSQNVQNSLRVGLVRLLLLWSCLCVRLQCCRQVWFDRNVRLVLGVILFYQRGGGVALVIVLPLLLLDRAQCH